MSIPNPSCRFVNDRRGFVLGGGGTGGGGTGGGGGVMSIGGASGGPPWNLGCSALHTTRSAPSLQAPDTRHATFGLRRYF
jgi:hypothetical protein